jgi:hypothetical protein
MGREVQLDNELISLQAKVEKNEIRARDAEARFRIIAAEVGILQQRKMLEDLRKS